MVDFFVPLADMVFYTNPLEDPPWNGDYLFGPTIIQKCIEDNDLEATPWDFGDVCAQNKDVGELYHARRVAYLVVNRSDHPISIDVGIPGVFSPPYLIFDGCHRLAAAIFRGDENIGVAYSGSVSLFKEMFPSRKKPKGKKS